MLRLKAAARQASEFADNAERELLKVAGWNYSTNDVGRSWFNKNIGEYLRLGEGWPI
jgi:hypothetical protein